MTLLVACVCASSAFSPSPWHHVRARPSVSVHLAMSHANVKFLPKHVTKFLPMHVGIETSVHKNFLTEIIDSIDEIRARLAACDTEEECAVEYATVLEEEIKAGDSMAARVDAAKRRAEVIANVARVRDEASDARAELEKLADEMKGAFAVLRKERVAERAERVRRTAGMDMQP